MLIRTGMKLSWMMKMKPKTAKVLFFISIYWSLDMKELDDDDGDEDEEAEDEDEEEFEDDDDEDEEEDEPEP